ncbi:hypothetical protein JCM5296_007263 [Sporobolomyces johnsonii]
MPLSPLSSTSPSDWRYTAEGGANLVLSYVGPPSPFCGRILRLSKRKKDTTPDSDAVPGDVGVEFGRSIVEPLLGRQQIVEMELVVLERDWTRRMVRRLQEAKVRPAQREVEDEVDVEAQVAVVAEDLVGGRGALAVEIKPKWGFLPSSLFLSPDTAATKATYCRFCMHRYHKSASTDHHELGYCPLDLYSGDETHMRRALDGLLSSWETSGGQSNSLRIFAHGQSVVPEDVSCLRCNPRSAYMTEPSRQPSALATAQDLLASSAPSPLRPSASFRSLLSSSLIDALRHSSLLPTLGHLQASLDPFDIEGLAHLLHSRLDVDLSSSRPDLSRLGPQPTLAEWQAWLAEHLSARSTPPEQPDPRSAILSFLLSATFKDCSIIVRFRRNTTTGNVETSVKAIDLDPKPINRLAKYWRMDREIVGQWKAMLDALSEEDRRRIRRCAKE